MGRVKQGRRERGERGETLICLHMLADGEFFLKNNSLCYLAPASPFPVKSKSSEIFGKS